MPPSLQRDIFSRLPVDQRARAACVCPAWHIALAEPALWTRLDLTRESGVTCRVDEAAVLAAAARAQGRLETLAVGTFAHAWLALRDVAAANAGSLRAIAADCFSSIPCNGCYIAELQALLAAGPALQVLDVPIMHCGHAIALSILRKEHPFQLLRLNRLDIHRDRETMDLSTLPVALVAHPSLTQLTLHGGNAPTGTSDALIDATLALRLQRLWLYDLRFTPEAVPALARVLSSTALTDLSVRNERNPIAAARLLDAPSALLFADALRANHTLRRLSLVRHRLWFDITDGLALLNGLVGHPSLRFIDLSSNHARNATDAVAVGAALGALVAADSSLEELQVSYSSLSDGGLLPLCEALPRNTHLRTLVVNNNGMSDAFARCELFPAVIANTSLLEVRNASHMREEEPAKNAMAVVSEFLNAREAVRVAEEAAAAGA